MSQHQRCPRCGSVSIETTTAPTLGDVDTNRAICRCGWRGIVEDLLPADGSSPMLLVSVDELVRHYRINPELLKHLGGNP